MNVNNYFNRTVYFMGTNGKFTPPLMVCSLPSYDDSLRFRLLLVITYIIFPLCMSCTVLISAFGDLL